MVILKIFFFSIDNSRAEVSLTDVLKSHSNLFPVKPTFTHIFQGFFQFNPAEGGLIFEHITRILKLAFFAALNFEFEHSHIRIQLRL